MWKSHDQPSADVNTNWSEQRAEMDNNIAENSMFFLLCVNLWWFLRKVMASFSSVDSEEVTLRRDIRITGTNQIESYTVSLPTWPIQCQCIQSTAVQFNSIQCYQPTALAVLVITHHMILLVGLAVIMYRNRKTVKRNTDMQLFFFLKLNKSILFIKLNYFVIQLKQYYEICS